MQRHHFTDGAWMGKWKCWTPNSGALVFNCSYATSWGWEIRVEDFEL